MKTPRSTGSFERLVLLAIERLQFLAYGMLIRDEIACRTGRSISVGAVYVTLMRMESKGWIRSVSRPRRLPAWRRARRFYIVEPPGRRAVRLVLRDSDQLRADLPGLAQPQPPAPGTLRGYRGRIRYAGPWPEEPSVVRRARMPRPRCVYGRFGEPTRTGPWDPWVRWWLITDQWRITDTNRASW